MEKSSTGLEANVAGLLCYVLWWVSGLVFVLLEQKSNFVRYHAVQSIYVFGVIHAALLVFGWIPGVNIVLTPIIGVIGLALWIFLMIRAYQGQQPKVLWAGNFAEKWVQKKGG